MKKTIIAAMFAFAAILGGNQLYKSQSVSNLSDIMKANVEALALDPGDNGAGVLCYNSIIYVESASVLYCGICLTVPGMPDLDGTTGRCPIY